MPLRDLLRNKRSHVRVVPCAPAKSINYRIPVNSNISNLALGYHRGTKSHGFDAPSSPNSGTDPSFPFHTNPPFPKNRIVIVWNSPLSDCPRNRPQVRILQSGQLTLMLQCFTKEAFSGSTVSAFRCQYIHEISILIQRPAQVVTPSPDRHEYFIEVPDIPKPPLLPEQRSGIGWPQLEAPASNRLV